MKKLLILGLIIFSNLSCKAQDTKAIETKMNYYNPETGISKSISYFKDINNLFDKYGRHLGYLILNDGRVLNEIMIKEGYAKPYNDVFCEMLPLYQEWNLQAKNSLKGLYSLVNRF